jgi:hypothetical protein
MAEEHDDYGEAITQINRSGAWWLLWSMCVLLVGAGGFTWLMVLDPDYDNVTCNGRPMQPGDQCTIVTKTTTITRSGQIDPGTTGTLSYEEMAEPDLPGSMAVWVTASLAVTGVGLWMVVSTARGWRADLRSERSMWVFPGDEERDATEPGSEQE